MAEPGTDPLSRLTYDVIDAGTYDRLVVGVGTPAGACGLLADVSPDQLLAVPVRSLGHADSMLAGLWLWHDGLHESHAIAQADRRADVAAAAMNFWHARYPASQGRVLRQHHVPVRAVCDASPASRQFG